jgi:sugar/nucleoside kinase (ribokinase family)
VSLVAVVGEDFPDRHVELLRGHGVDLSGLATVPGRTFRWGGEYTADFSSRNTLFTELNVFADFRPQLSESQRDAEYVFLANIHPELQASVLEQMRSPRLVVLDTMNYWIERVRDALLEPLRRVDVILLNDEEARMLSGHSNLIRAGRAVLDLGPSLAVIKKGEHGSLLVSRSYTASLPAYPVEDVRDPTGAGDTFAGGFVGHLAGCDDPFGEDHQRRAAVQGTVLASFAVEGFSVEGLLAATPEAVGTRVAELKELARF